MPLEIPETITARQFLELIDDEIVKKKPRIRLAYMLGFFQCMRVSEICKLKPEDYNPETKLLYLKKAKGHKDRHIPVAPEVIRGLKYLPVGSQMAKDKGIRALQYQFAKDTERVLGHRLNIHILRHSGVTYLLNVKKWDTRQIQRFVGHSDIKITQIYEHVNPEDLTKLMWEGKE
jgi:integrase/recombinase XerD